MTIVLSPVEMETRKKLNFRAGDVVKVDTKVKESSEKDGKVKYRVQAFEGAVIARKHGSEAGATFTVRKMSGSIAVERIFPLYSPMIETIKVVRSNKTSKSKTYFIREKAAKEVRKKLKELKKGKVEVIAEDAE